jgi:hypothetical protein
VYRASTYGEPRILTVIAPKRAVVVRGAVRFDVTCAVRDVARLRLSVSLPDPCARDYLLTALWLLGVIVNETGWSYLCGGMRLMSTQLAPETSVASTIKQLCANSVFACHKKGRAVPPRSRHRARCAGGK